jgi:hypothetical protein
MEDGQMLGMKIIKTIAKTIADLDEHPDKV